MFSVLVADLRYGWRMLRKNPGFSAITVATLALGIGGNTALFSVVDAVLLRPLPFPEHDRLVVVSERPPSGRRTVASAATFLDWRAQNRVFSQLAALNYVNVDLSVNGSPDRVPGLRVSAEYFDVLGVPPALGRTFTPEDDRPGAPCIAVIGYGAFERRLGADRRAIGRDLTIGGAKCTLVGVMPPEFRFANGPEVWAPLRLDPAQATRTFHYLTGLGRLKPGVTLEQARAQMLTIARDLERAYPDSNKGWSVHVDSLHSLMVDNERTSVLVLLGAVAFVLLIGCVNVANLLLAKAAERQRELAVRASLGAGRRRILGQVLTESALLALAGGFVGVAMAFWLVRVTPLLLPKSLLQGVGEIGVDWRVLLFALGISLFTGLLFGLAPAWRASRVDLQGALKEGGRGTSRATHGRLRGVLVTGEIALSLTLLVGAGLLVRSMVAMYSAEIGLDPENTLTMRLSMPRERYSTPALVRSFHARVLERVRALPGVRAATISMHTPLEGSSLGMLFQVVGQPERPLPERQGAPFQIVSHDFLQTFGIKLKRGRFFTERDDENAPRVAVVNETFVKEVLGKEEPIGRRLRIEELVSGQMKFGPEVTWEIVGVIANVKYRGLDGAEMGQIYVPLPQSPWLGGLLAIRTTLEPQRMSNAVREAVRQVDSQMAVTDVRTMQQIVGESATRPKVRTWIVGAFAAVALLLAALGVYGVISYTVEQSVHDLGIRMALGARPGDLVRMTLRRGLILTGVGLAIGLAGSFALTRAMSSLLYRVRPDDPFTYVLVALALAAVSLLAAYIPARRAAAVDPIVALRCE